MFRQELEKKPEQPFMMYIAFDDLQVLIHQIGLCFFTIFYTNIAGATASGGEVEGSLPFPGETMEWSGVEEKVIVIVKTCTHGLRDLLMTKIDLEVRRVKSEALSKPASSLFGPFVNNLKRMSRGAYFQEDETRKTYLGMLTALDDAVGRIVNHLRRCHVAETAKSYQKCDTKCAG